MPRKREHQYASATRDIRDTLADNTFVLDEFTPMLHDGASTDDVCKLLGIEPWTPRHHIKKHADELVAAGYNPDERTWSRQAIIRLALLTRGPGSLAVSEAAGFQRITSITSARTGAGHVNRCKRIVGIATDMAVRVKDEDPADVWLELETLSAYDLKGVIIALAAVVPVEGPLSVTLAELIKLAPHHSKRYGGDGAASGLAQLVPVKGLEPTRETA